MLRNLIENSERRNQREVGTYEKVLEKIKKRINTVSNYSKNTECVYQVPRMIVGVARYDVAKATMFCRDKLVDIGLICECDAQTGILAISWNIDHITEQYNRRNKELTFYP